MQLGLDLQYPALSHVNGLLQLVGIHQRPPGLPVRLLPDLLAPFAMCTPLACPDYYGASAPPRAFSGRCAYPASRGWSPRGGTGTRWFPCSLRIDRPGRHPALPRQHRHGYAAGLHRDLPTGTPSQLRSQPPPGRDDHALHPGPYPPDLSRCHAYGALHHRFLFVRLLVSLAGPAPSGSPGTSRLCQRCFPPSPATSRIRLRSASTRLLRQPSEKAFHLLRTLSASRRTSASWRTTKSSASLEADDRPSRTSQPQSRTKIRYSRRRGADDHDALQPAMAIAAAHRPCRLLAPHRADDVFFGTPQG